MSRNQDSSSYQRLTQIYHVVFRLTGLLIYTKIDEPHFLRRKLKNILIGAYGLLTCILHFSMFLSHGIRMLVNNRLEFDTICEIITALGIISRYVIMYLHRWDFLELTSECRNLWRLFVHDDEVDTVGALIQKVYHLGQFFFGSTALTVTAYIITAQFVQIPAVEANGTSTRILPMKYYVDVQEEPWYSIVSVKQAIVGYSIGTLLTGIETAGPFLILMACGYLRIINERLTDMRRDHMADQLPIKKVLVCVQFHQATLRFCERIEQFTRSLFMIQVLTSVYNMSLIAIKILEKDERLSRYVTFFGFILLQFFTCQWIPQHLFNESEAIAEAVYGVAVMHRRFNLKANKMLHMMLLRACRPVQLTAGGIVRLSLESFKTMIVNAFSFFTVLRNFTA